MAGAGRSRRPSPTALRGRTVPSVALAVLLALAATHVPRRIDSTPYALAFLGVIALGVLAGALGAWRHRGTAGIAGWLIVAALVCPLIANTGYFVELAFTGGTTWPGWTDVFYLSHYALLLAAVVAVLRKRGDRNAAAMIDAATLSFGVGVVFYVFLVADTVTDPSVEPVARVLNGLYPLLDIFVLGMVARLMLGSGGRGGATLLALGMSTQFTGDMLLLVPAISVDTGELRRLTDVSYLACYLLLAAALWHRDADRMVARDGTADEGMTRGRLILLGASGLLAPATLLWRAQAGQDPHVRVVAIAAIVMFLLTLTRMFLLVRAVERSSRQLAVQARTDALTGLANRRTFDFHLERAMRSEGGSGPADGPVHVALVDLDHFKQYNDTLGHGAGDQLLRECAAHWAAELEAAAPGSVLARYGGEEFAIVLRTGSTELAVTALRRMLAVTPAGRTFSAGVARWDGAETALELLRRADELMYRAKDEGRRRVIGEQLPAAAAVAS